MRVVRLSLVPAAVAAVLVVGVLSVWAATPATTYTTSTVASPEPQANGRWSERIVTAGDLDGDGVSDLFMASPFHDTALTNEGRVYVVSGKDRHVIRTINAPEPQAGAAFGFYISSPGDLSGDGRRDVVAGSDAQDVYTGSGPACGAPEPNGCNERQGRAWAIDGVTGAVLYTLNNPDPQGTTANTARFGSRIGGAGDVNADGTSDVIVGASNNDVPAGCGDVNPVPAGCRRNQGQAYIFNGRTGALIRTLNVPAADLPAAPCTANCGTFGIAVQSPGDTDGDGRADHLVDAGNISFYTGTGAPCGAPEPNGCNEGQGRMYVFSGATGNLLLRIDDPVPQAGATFGFQDVEPNAPGDVNGDGFADLYANGFAQAGPTGEGEGRAWVFNGKTGALLYTLTDPSPETGGQFGWSMAKTDYDKDGRPDLYVGQSPHHVPGTVQSGGTYVFKGSDGSLLKALELPASDVQPGATGDVGPALGWGLAAPGDLNADGEPDYVGGAPFFNVGANANQGRMYVFSSVVPAATPTATPTGTATPTPSPYVIPTPTPTPYPVARRRPGLSAKVRPKRDPRRPFRFTTSGRLRLPSGVSRAAGCRGKVAIRAKPNRSAKTISNRLATVKGNCTFSRRVTFKHPRRFGKGKARRRGTLRFRIRFQGNAVLTPRTVNRTARYGRR